MYFESFADLIAMGKHGAFVWSAYGISLLVLAINVALPILGKRSYLQEEARRLRRESKQ